MLKELINSLQTLKNEADQLNQLPEDQRAVLLATIAEKVLNTLENANIELPEEYSIDSGEEIPTSEV
jgi:hypothetical protein